MSPRARRRRPAPLSASPPDDFAIATFGFMTAAKRPEVLLRAFARLRREVPRRDRRGC